MRQARVLSVHRNDQQIEIGGQAAALLLGAGLITAAPLPDQGVMDGRFFFLGKPPNCSPPSPGVPCLSVAGHLSQAATLCSDARKVSQNLMAARASPV